MPCLAGRRHIGPDLKKALNMRADAICFDKDGTLFDFGATWEVWARSFLLRTANQDHERAAEIGQTIGFDLAENRFAKDSIVIAGTAGQVAEALAPLWPHLSTKEVLDLLNEEAETAPQSEAVPLIPFLDGLRAMGLRLGVATNDAENPARAFYDSQGFTVTSQNQVAALAPFNLGLHLHMSMPL